ncbi:TSUP family transporter [Bowmanella denitrificans]|uniref:TSUP family transporter n=1 Tax=Bowmanella denitrificans TaxID=366582 RepID=UPI000C9C6AF1|nr:TSUP family transporter [Bowmanella denitrificans]
MLMDLDPFSLGLIALVVVLTGISKSGFAGALGIFSVPLLLLVLSPQQALGLMLPLLLLADMFSLKSYWRQWDGATLRVLLPGVAIGLLLGGLLLGHLPTLWLQGLIGSLSCLHCAICWADICMVPGWQAGLQGLCWLRHLD